MRHSKSHNPYFNRWFSAIKNKGRAEIWIISHNPYFNRWFSAIAYQVLNYYDSYSHNPYFNRWFSAICNCKSIPLLG